VTAEAAKAPNGEQVAAGTNNEAERSLRPVALARKSGSTNKTAKGARCQTVIVSVLVSLRHYLGTFTLQTLIEERKRWSEASRSCFVGLAERLGLPAPGRCILDVLIRGPRPQRTAPVAAAEGPAAGGEPRDSRRSQTALAKAE